MPQHLSLPTAQEEAPSMTPVWAPNPGVPWLARVLAYLFGALMLLAIALTFTTERPPDLPVPPTGWETHRLVPSLAVPYPAGWTAETLGTGKTLNAVFSQRVGGPVRVELLSFMLPVEPDSAGREALRGMMAAALKQEYPDYTPGETDNGLQRFTVTLSNGSTEVAGGWLLTTHARRVVILIGLTPARGWDIMEAILREMDAGVKSTPTKTE